MSEVSAAPCPGTAHGEKRTHAGAEPCRATCCQPGTARLWGCVWDRFGNKSLGFTTKEAALHQLLPMLQLGELLLPSRSECSAHLQL